jgi:Protein of unknown function (DUF2634)
MSETFLPQTTTGLSSDEALAQLEEALDPTSGRVDLIVRRDPPVPLGRGWAFDFSRGRFLPAPGGHGARETHGAATLRGWIEKCLSTDRGAHPIHPPGYGLTRRADLIGGPVAHPPADLEDRIRDALTFHPRIVDIVDFGVGWDDNDDYLAVSFTAVTDQHDRLPFDVLLANP